MDRRWHVGKATNPQRRILRDRTLVFYGGSDWVGSAERAIIYVLGNATAAAAGSVTGGLVTGSTVGSWIPGAGTAVGAVGGLLAGAAVDMWISHRNKERTVNEVVKSLNEIETGILHGDGKHPGIEKIFNDAAARQAQQLDTKLRKQIEEAAR